MIQSASPRQQIRRSISRAFPERENERTSLLALAGGIKAVGARELPVGINAGPPWPVGSAKGNLNGLRLPLPPATCNVLLVAGGPDSDTLVLDWGL